MTFCYEEWSKEYLLEAEKINSVIQKYKEKLKVTPKDSFKRKKIQADLRAYRLIHRELLDASERLKRCRLRCNEQTVCAPKQ